MLTTFNLVQSIFDFRNIIFREKVTHIPLETWTCPLSQKWLESGGTFQTLLSLSLNFPMWPHFTQQLVNTWRLELMISTNRVWMEEAVNHLSLERLRTEEKYPRHRTSRLNLSPLCGHAPTGQATFNRYWATVLEKKNHRSLQLHLVKLPWPWSHFQNPFRVVLFKNNNITALSRQPLSYFKSFTLHFAPTMIFIYVFYRNKAVMKVWRGWSESSWTHCTVPERRRKPSN